MMKDELLFKRVACGEILKSVPDDEVLQNQNALIKFIEDEPVEAMEHVPSQRVLDEILQLEQTLVSVSKGYLKSMLLDAIDEGDADTLKASASADIWYDARDYNDTKAMVQITETQNAMDRVSQAILNIIKEVS